MRSHNTGRLSEPIAARLSQVSEPDPDAPLAKRAQEDESAFLPLYERYVGRVYGYCLARLGDRTRAEDATSETFLKALEGIHGFRGGSFAAWIFAIARNVVVDVHRRRRLDSSGDTSAIADDGASPEDGAVRAAEREAFSAALSRLTGDQRLVIELQIAGWRGAEIARALGRSEAAVKMLRLRGLKRLRRLLRDAGWER